MVFCQLTFSVSVIHHSFTPPLADRQENERGLQTHHFSSLKEPTHLLHKILNINNQR